MTSTTQPSTAEEIVDKVGGPGNILSLTHCATRLRFELKDASQVDQKAVEKIPGVMGAVPQSGDRYQVVIGGAVQTTFNEIMNLPAMAGGRQGPVRRRRQGRASGPRPAARSPGWTPSSSTCPTRSVRSSACCSARR